MKKGNKKNGMGKSHSKNGGTNGTYQPALPREKVDRMFVDWIQHRNASKTARAFKVSNSAVYKYIKNEDWEARAKEIDGMKQKEVARRIVREFKSNLDAVKKVKNKVLEEILVSTRLSATIADLMRLVEYEDAAMSGGESGKQNIIIQIVTAINEGEDFGSDEDIEEDQRIFEALKKHNRFRGN